MHPTTPEEVHAIIKKLKNAKAPGADGIQSEVVKKLNDLNCHLLAEAINLSLQQEKYPDILKTAIITQSHNLQKRRQNLTEK